MKRAINILIGLLVLTLSSCYDDQGNYDYEELNKITFTDSLIQKNYLVEQFDTLQINPVFAQSINKDESDLEYLWLIYANNTWGYADTLSKNRNLEIPITLALDNYTALYRVINKSTGVFYEYPFKIEVINSYSKGILVLSEVEGQANLAFLNTKGTLGLDVFHSVNGTFAGNNPTVLGISANRYEGRSVFIGCNDEQGGAVTEATGFKKLSALNELFFLPEKNPNPQFFATNKGRSAIEDGMIANNDYYFRSFMYPPPVKYGTSLSLAINKGVKLFPFVFDEGPYVSSSNVVYDNANKKFWKKNSRDVFTGFPPSSPDIFDRNDTRLTMLEAGEGFKGEGYALCEDDAGTLFIITFNPGGSQNMVPTGKFEIKSATEIQARTAATFTSLSPQLFYAVGNKLYCLDVKNDLSRVIYSFEEDVTIDCIKLSKINLDKVMYLGTSKEGTGKRGSFHILDVQMNGAVEVRESYENCVGKVVDFLDKE